LLFFALLNRSEIADAGVVNGHGPLDVEIGEGASPAVLNCI
jgi:hypothetical protein